MKRPLLVAALAGIVSLAAHSQNTTTEAYPIIVDGLWGYINTKGDVIIKPRFRNALDFSEGLAPVRLNGTYGFINLSGDFVIQPQYDYAEPFYDGRARIYLDGKPYYIDKTGNKLFEHNFQQLGHFNRENGLALVTTVAKKRGFIDKQGRLVVDTLYDIAWPFSEGRVVVRNDRESYAILDTRGKVVVPMGRFEHIGSFKNGYSYVNWMDADSVHHDGIIDTSGTIRLHDNNGKLRFRDSGGYSDGVVVVTIYKQHKDSIRTWPDDKKKLYCGAMDMQGNIIVSDTAWKELTPFVSGRAFASDIHGDWYLVDKKGQRVNNVAYDKIVYGPFGDDYEDLFRDGKELVETKDGWQVIDPDGNVILRPDWLNEDVDEVQRVGSMVYFAESDEGDYNWGYWDMTTGEVVSPQFESISFTASRDDLSVALQDDRQGYINKQGIYVWRGQAWSRNPNQKLNIDYMNRGYFYAASLPKKNLRGLGGWGGSKNMFMRVTKLNHFEKNKLSSTVLTIDERRSSSRILYIANTTRETYIFEAQDSRLYLKLQALDKNGVWRDIEYLPSSWCGNSYHQIYLPPDHYWSFEMPVYEGDFKTKLRAELQYKLKTGSRESLKLYSQEFDGSVNPGQFWRKAGYTPGGIMDPYND